MKPSLLLALLMAPLPVLSVGMALGQTVCADGPSGQVYSFVAPPLPSAAVRAALRVGRVYLQRGQGMAQKCAESAAGMESGYVVATLSLEEVRFAGPEAVPEAALSCLRRVVKRLGAAPAPYGGRGEGRTKGALPQDLEVQAIWWLHPPTKVAPPPMSVQEGPAGRRSFAEIEAEVGRHLPGLSTCFGELWEERPHAAGTLVLRLTLGESGLVEGAEVLRREPTMQAAEACLLRVAGRLRFPSRWGAGRTVMSYPLVFSPPEAAESAVP